MNKWQFTHHESFLRLPSFSRNGDTNIEYERSVVDTKKQIMNSIWQLFRVGIPRDCIQNLSEILRRFTVYVANSVCNIPQMFFRNYVLILTHTYSVTAADTFDPIILCTNFSTYVFHDRCWHIWSFQRFIWYVALVCQKTNLCFEYYILILLHNIPMTELDTFKVRCNIWLDNY